MVNNKSMHKILQEIAIDARTKRKDIARKMRISPQMVSYLISRAEKQGLIQRYTTDIDPARFGLINVEVFLSYKHFERETLKEIKRSLEEEEYITYIEELSHGADMLIEYTVPNLSFFNKRYNIMVEMFGDKIETLSINPVIVKHKFSKNYLVKRSKRRYEYIYSGDREALSLSAKSKAVLSELKNKPKRSIMEIANSTGINVRTVLSTMRYLLDNNIIRSFSIDMDYKKLDIRSALILISTKGISNEEIKRLISLSKSTPEITTVTKLIGKYGIVLKIESLKDYEEILDGIRKEMNFNEYILYDSRGIVKNTYIPDDVLQ